MNNTMFVSNNFLTTQSKRLKTASITVQTDSNPQFLKLNIPCRLEKTNLTQILPLIMDSATDQQHSILDYNEKLKKPADFPPNKSRIFSTFSRPSSSTECVSDSNSKLKTNLSAIYEDLMCIAACNNDFENVQDQYINIYDATRTALEDVQCQLEIVSKRLTSAFQKEMDKRYIETATMYAVIKEQDLISGKALFKEEQSILARRLTAVLQNILADKKPVHFFDKIKRSNHTVKDKFDGFADLLCRICTLLDNNCCGLYYSGLMLSIILLIEIFVAHSQIKNNVVVEIAKHIISSRAMLFVPCRLLRVLCSLTDIDRAMLCSGSIGNLKFDYDQGVLLYKKDSCLLQVFLTQIESSLKCMERQNLVPQVVELSQNLLQFYTNINSSRNYQDEKSRCNCRSLLLQVIVHALKICSIMLDDDSENYSTHKTNLLSVCRTGLQVLYKCIVGDVEYASKLDYNEGYLIEFCERLQQFDHNEFHGTILTEMMMTFQSVTEYESTSFNRQAWLRSFDTFSLTD